MKQKKSKILLYIIYFIFIIAVVCNIYIYITSINRIYNDISKIPKNRVGLLLGTSKYQKNGKINLFFTYRIKAAYELFKNKKIDFILASGSNASKNYNEPLIMKKELIKLGIPKNKIYLDFAGFRTLDSVVRCKKIFSQKKVTIISQEFHNTRAIFLARKNGIDAIAYNAKMVYSIYSLKILIREFFAKVKAVLDIYILKTNPKFLGKKIVIK